MKRVYATLAALCFSVSLVTGVAMPVQSQDTKSSDAIVVPTFDDGEAFTNSDELLLGESFTTALNYNLWSHLPLLNKKISKSTRLLVITEPDWCPPCEDLDPILKDLKKQGYDVHRYTQSEWFKAKPKPNGVPGKVEKEGHKVRVPTLLFVRADEKTNTVLHWKRGWMKNMDDAKYIKKYLTK